MDYEITRLVLGASPSLKIAETDFRDITQSTDSLLKMLNLEEDYDSLIGNFLDFERAVLSLSAESFVQRRTERVEMDRDHRLLNRMIANVLTAARAFIDHSKHRVSSILSGQPEDLQRLNKLFSAQYDGFLAFRVIEALRNYTQHCGVPSQSINYQMRWSKDDQHKEQRIVSNVAPVLLIRALSSRGEFKKKILEELLSLNIQELPLVP